MKRVVAVMLMVAAFVLAACGETSNSTAVPATVPAEFAGKTNPLGADAAAEGENIFQINCTPCHGPQGHGDGPASQALDPKPKNLAELQQTVGDDYLFWRISTGKAGTSMVAWAGTLTDEQIWQVITYLHTLK